MTSLEESNEESTRDGGPLVSIVTPAFNAREFLPETIESVRRQSYPHIEHLVVDGGSADGSQELVEQLRHDGLRYWSEPDEGQADALVKGFARARGAILGWLNADDVYLHDEVVATVVRALEAEPALDVVTAGGVYITEQGAQIAPIQAPVGLTTAELRRVDKILQPATFFRRTVLDSIGIDRTLHYAFDWDFFARALARYEFRVLDEPLAGYRLHGTSKTIVGGSRRTWEIAEVTRRNLGPRSPQYRILRAVAAADQRLDALPRPIRPALRRLLYAMLRALRSLSRGRLQT